jgi:RNA polymerase sigma-70 factor (ECF subfamily)
MAESDSAYHTRPSLLARIKDARDDQAWVTFVDVYAPLLYRYALRRGLQGSDAADVAQDVLLQVARSVRTFEYQPERGRFRDWLGAVANRKISDQLRSGRRSPSTSQGQPGDVAEPLAAGEPGGEWAAEFHSHVLRMALERVRPHFEPNTWRAFELAWLEGQPADAVAKLLAMPVDNVYVAKSRVLKRLREEVTILAEDLPLYVPLG